MKSIFGIVLIVIALLLFLGVYIYTFKKETYKGDFLSLIIDSVEFLIFIGALIFIGVILITEKA